VNPTASAAVNQAASEARPADSLDPATGLQSVATRIPASRMPSITGVRISPAGVEGTLVNISATGVLVECDRRLKPLSSVTVIFHGTFQPASISSKVARCAVAGIGGDGALRYHVGVAFNAKITLEQAPEPPVERVHETQQGTAVAPVTVPVLRNRW
jgi:hypothetical protein